MFLFFIRMPVPQLDHSISKYINAISHLVTEKDLENTKRVSVIFVKERKIEA